MTWAGRIARPAAAAAALRAHARRRARRPAAAAATGAREELCVIVDEKNAVVRLVGRRETVSKRLLGRGAYCVVLDEARAHMLVQRRSESKDLYPGMLEVCVAGVCTGTGLAGQQPAPGEYEGYEDTALRELTEELGLPRGTTADELSLRRVGAGGGVFEYEDDSCHVFACVLEAAVPDRMRSALTPQAEEVQWARWVPIEEACADLEGVTPVGRQVLARWRHEQRLT